MGLRYSSYDELRKAVSPDVIIEDDDHHAAPKPLKKDPANPSLVAKPNREVLQDKFYAQWQALGGPQLQAEYRFHTERRYRMDFALVDQKIGFEIQGGLYQAKSGHRTQEGVMRDCEKLNCAQMEGWRVFQITSPMINDSGYLEKIIEFVNDSTIVWLPTDGLVGDP